MILEEIYEVDPDLASRCSLTKNRGAWKKFLLHDNEAPFLLSGICRGFKIEPEAKNIAFAECRNYRSALTPPVKTLIDQYFLKKLELGRISKRDRKPRRVHAIGTVLKKGTNKYRLITDCGRPFADCQNSHIKSEQFTFDSIDDAPNASTPSCYYAVVNIESAFRHVPVFSPHRELQGFSWGFG